MNKDIKALSEIVGPEKMEEICKKLGRKRIYIPQSVRYQRDEELKKDYEILIKMINEQNYDSIFQILIEKYSLSERQIRRVISSH